MRKYKTRRIARHVPHILESDRSLEAPGSFRSLRASLEASKMAIKALEAPEYGGSSPNIEGSVESPREPDTPNDSLLSPGDSPGHFVAERAISPHGSPAQTHTRIGRLPQSRQ